MNDKMTEKAEKQVGLILRAEFWHGLATAATALLLAIVALLVKEVRTDVSNNKQQLAHLESFEKNHVTKLEMGNLELRIMQIIATLPPADWKARVVAIETKLDGNATSLARIEAILVEHMKNDKKQP